MGIISVTLPTDGTTADVSDFGTPVTTIVNAINGNLDNSNISASAAIASSKISGLNPSNFSNPYKFFVYRNGSANAGNAAFLLVTFDTAVYDTGTNYSTSTGKFTAPISGFYQFNVTTFITAGSAAIVSIAKNSTTAEYMRLANIQSQGIVGGSTILQLSAADTISVLAFSSAGNPLGVGSSPFLTYFSGFLVSAT